MALRTVSLPLFAGIMDYLKSLFGTIDQKSSLSFDSKPSSPVENVPTSGINITLSSKQELSLDPITPEVSNIKQHTFSDTLGEAGSRLKSSITRFIPLEDGDCLSCKLTGVTVMWGAAGFILFQATSIRHRYTGFRKVAFYIQVASLSSGVFVLGVARLLDKSIFEKNKEEKKNILNLVVSDLENIKHKLKISSTDLTTKKHPGD